MAVVTVYQMIILDKSKLKAFAENKINLTKKSKLGLGSVENIVGEEETAVYLHSLLFPECFQKSSHSESSKVWIV